MCFNDGKCIYCHRLKSWNDSNKLANNHLGDSNARFCHDTVVDAAENKDLLTDC